jgi:hypothetical protein
MDCDRGVSHGHSSLRIPLCRFQGEACVIRQERRAAAKQRHQNVFAHTVTKSTGVSELFAAAVQRHEDADGLQEHAYRTLWQRRRARHDVGLNQARVPP